MGILHNFGVASRCSERKELAPPWREAQSGDPWTDDDDLSLQALCQEWEVEIRQRGIVAAVAKDITFHPVRDYLLRESRTRRSMSERCS